MPSPAFFIGGGGQTEGQEQIWFLGRGQQTPSPPARGLGSAASSPAGFGVDPQPPKGFPLFSALRMASPDSVILLTVDYHAAIGVKSKTSVAPLHTLLAVLALGCCQICYGLVKSSIVAVLNLCYL